MENLDLIFKDKKKPTSIQQLMYIPMCDRTGHQFSYIGWELRDIFPMGIELPRIRDLISLNTEKGREHAPMRA